MSEERKRKLYIYLSRTPILSLLLKGYIQKTSPVWHVSVKKTGRTWLAVMLGKALQLHFEIGELKDVLLYFRENSKFAFRGINFIHDDVVHWKRSHELCKSKEHFKFKKVILQVRDPRDVVVSNFFEKKLRLKAYIDGEKLYYSNLIDRICPYESDLSHFIREPVGSFDSIIQFYNIWAKNSHLLRESLFLLRYEDMHKDPHKELRRVLDFIGIEHVSRPNINKAVEYATFQKMQIREQNVAEKSIKLKAVDVNDIETYKSRKGKVGGFVDYLSAQDICYLNKKMKRNLSCFYRYGV